MRVWQEACPGSVEDYLLEAPLQAAVHMALPAFAFLEEVEQVTGAPAALRAQRVQTPEAPLKAPGKS